MEKLDSQDLDPKQKARVTFRHPQLRPVTSAMENYALKLRKDKRENTITARRARALEEMTSTSPHDSESEMATLIEYLHREPPLMEQSSYPDTALKIIARSLLEGTYCYEALLLLRKLLVGSHTDRLSVDQAFAAGMVTLCPMFLQLGNPVKVLREASWVLSVLTSSSNEAHIKDLASHATVKMLFDLIDFPEIDVSEHAMLSLANIVYTEERCKEQLAELEIYKKLQDLLNRPKVPLRCKKAAVYLVRILLESTEPDLMLSLPLLPQLIEYLWESDDLLIEDALASLAVLLKLAEEVNLDDFITLPMLKMLIAYSKDDKKEIKNPALMCVLSVSSADDKFGPMLIKAGALEMVEKVIKSRNYAKICEVCLLLSNLAAAGVETIQKILRFGIYSEVQKLLRDDNLYVIREVVWIVQNTFFIATEEQLDELVGKGLLELTVDLLRIRDTGLQTQILRFLEKFMTRVKTLKNEEIKEKVRVTLYESKGIDKVDMLCMHYNKEIAGLAEKVIEVDSELAKESTRFNN